ncbi:MAG: DUF1501 domain-containing protein, partial [Planctomycetota bacterium]
TPGSSRRGFPRWVPGFRTHWGSVSDNLPAFVVLPDHRGFPYNNAGNFSAAFLPAAHQGVVIKPNAPIPIANLRPPDSAKQITAASEADGLKLLEQLNRDHLAQHTGDSRLEGRNWRGWHHHQILSLMATWFLTLETDRGKQITPAITVPQIRDGIAMLLRAACNCNTPTTIAKNKTRRLIRNEEARFYHYKARNRLPPIRLKQTQ